MAADFSNEQVSVQRSSHRFRKYLRNFLLIVIAIFAISFYWVFVKKYGEGERTGILVKFTHKGNIFKTDEGELWLSCRQMTNPEKFYFSVTDDSLAKVLRNLTDECVQVNYKQYIGKLPWRGDSKYIVTGVTAIAKK